MNKEEILELFRITSEKVAQIRAETEAKIAVAEGKIAAAQTKIADAEAERKQHEAKIAAIRSEAEADRKEYGTKIAAARTQSEQYRKDTDKALKRVSQHLGGHTKTVADIAEEYFYRALKGHPHIGQIHFDKVLLDQKYGYKQYDIIMVNNHYIALVSVKTIIRERDIVNLVRSDLPALKTFYSQIEAYKEAKYIGVVAGLTCKARALEKAKELGIGVLTQSEDNRATIINKETTLTVF